MSTGKKVSVPKFFRSSGYLFSHQKFDLFGAVPQMGAEGAARDLGWKQTER
ncbi:MAG: hypothetical protein JWR26_2360 [Pedosphaera sp.]|nr:hypothetical protein [Pedosphaera sp.]